MKMTKAQKKAKKREYDRRRAQCPEWRKGQNERQRKWANEKYKTDPEFRKMRARYDRLRWKNPGFREEQRERCKMCPAYARALLRQNSRVRDWPEAIVMCKLAVVTLKRYLKKRKQKQ